MFSCINIFQCDQGNLQTVRFTDGGFHGLTCGSDRQIKMWDLSLNKRVNTYVGHTGDVMDAVSSLDSSRIVSGSQDRSLIFWDFSTATPIRRLVGHNDTVTCVSLKQDCTVIFSGSLDRSVFVWDARSNNSGPEIKFEEARDGVTSMSYIPCEILTGSLDGYIRRYDLRINKLMIYNIDAPISCVNYSNDGQCFLVSATNKAVRLIDKMTSLEVGKYTGSENKNMHIKSCLNGNDSTVIGGSSNGYIYVWDRISRNLSYRLLHVPDSSIHTVSFHPLMDRLLSASSTVVKLWGMIDEVKK